MHSTLPPAIVVGLDCVTGLQTARILHDRGIRVVGLAADLEHYCCRTRCCAERHRVEIHELGLLKWLREYAASQPAPPVLFPCTDVSVRLISRHRSELAETCEVVLPAHGVVETLLDKSRFYRLALARGLPIPRTAFLTDLGDCEEAARTFSFPCALKPPVKTALWLQATREKVFKVADADELLRLYEHLAPAVEELILQEWIPGGDDDLFACYAYLDADSRPLVVYESHKLRQWPLETGSGTLAELQPVESIRRTTLELLGGTGFRGLAFVQFKRHPETGVYYLLEPNVGRPGVGMPIGEAGGAEILFTMYCDAVGLPLPSSRSVTGPAKWICWRRDLSASLALWLRGRLSLRGWLRSLRGRKRAAIWRRSDPAPFLADLFAAPLRAAGRLRSRGR